MIIKYFDILCESDTCFNRLESGLMFPQPQKLSQFFDKAKKRGWTKKYCPNCNPKSKIDIDGKLK